MSTRWEQPLGSTSRRGQETRVRLGEPLLSRARRQLHAFVEELRAEVEQGVATGRAEIADRARRRRRETAEELGGLAESLRDTALRVDPRQRLGLDRYANRWADRLDESAAYVRERPVAEIVEDVESFARRRPVVFAAGGFIAGVVAARFLKSSANPRRSRESLSFNAS
jgi:hypothetical protein